MGNSSQGQSQGQSQQKNEIDSGKTVSKHYSTDGSKLFYGNKEVPAQNDYYGIITCILKSMAGSPKEREVADKVREQFEIPLEVCKLFFKCALSAVKAVPQESPSPEARVQVILPGSTCTVSAAHLQRHGADARLYQEMDGIQYPPEEAMSLDQIETQGRTVEALVQLTRNKFIRLGDAGFVLLDAGPLNYESIEDADEQCSFMLPSAGYVYFVDISILFKSQVEEAVTFSVCAKSLNDYMSEAIICLLVQTALKDGTVGQVSVESAAIE